MSEQRRIGTELEAESRAKAEALIDEMASFHIDARRVLSALGADATSGGFLGQAEAEHKSADRWRWLGVGLIASIAAWGAVTILTTGGSDFTLQWLAGRLLVALPLLGVGLYAIAESGRHREKEWSARRSELDLVALDPFVALLDGDKRNELKFELAKRAFLQGASAVKPGGGEDVVARLLDIVGDAVKRK